MTIELAEEAGTELAVPDKVSTALATITTTNATFSELRDKAVALAERYRGVVWDVRTVKGMDEACKARAELRAIRYDMQKLQTGGKRMLNDLKRDFDGRAEDLIKEVEFAEEPIDQLIKVEEARKATEKAERDRIEGLRIQAHVDALAVITGSAPATAGMDSAFIQVQIDLVGQLDIGESWEEFRGQAQQAKDEALRQLNGMLVAAKADEQERAELEQERQRQAAFKKEQDERQAELDAQAERQRVQQEEQQRFLDQQAAQMREQQAQLDAQREQQERALRERAEAVQGRIDAIDNLMDGAENLGTESLQAMTRTLDALAVTPDLFDDRVVEAEAARATGLRVCGDLLPAAQKREAEEARQARAAQIQVNINNLMAYTAPADASSQFLAERIAALHNEPVAEEFYGDRVDEAIDIMGNALELLIEARRVAVGRERSAAEEAERQRKEIEANAAAVARTTRMQDAAQRMFDVLVEVAGMGSNGKSSKEFDLDTFLTIAEFSAEIINEIEGVQA